MEVRFDKDYDKNCFVFPFYIEWRKQLWQYCVPASALTIWFLWWGFRWTFIRER